MSPPRASTSRYPATAFSNADSCHPSTLPASHLAGIFYMAVSEAGARLLQKFHLFRCADATQYVVAMGEAAKALDDHLMAAGKVGKSGEGCLRRCAGLLRCQCFEQRHASGLLFTRFGMFQRQIEEDPRQWREGLVCPDGQPFQAEIPCQRILCKGRRRAAMDITRQLVEQQDQRQSTAGGIGPVGEAAFGRCLCQLAEAAGQQGIRFAAFSPPEGACRVARRASSASSPNQRSSRGCQGCMGTP